MWIEWIDQVDCQALRSMAKHSASMYLATRIDGTILWANESFCVWSNYSLPELQRMTWMQLSSNDQDLETDIELTTSLNDYKLRYSIQKRYIPKNGKASIGNLHVTRYPPSGEIDFCWCRWEPLTNGTADALEVAIKANREMVIKVTELAQEVKSLSSRTEEESFFVSMVRMAIKYPKVSLACVALTMGVSGCDSIVKTMERLGVISAPPVVVKEIQK